MPRQSLGHNKLPIQWVQGAVILHVKWSGCKAEGARPTSAKVKNEWSYEYLCTLFAFTASRGISLFCCIKIEQLGINKA
jgi:hypothetical protein